ncbi:MAG: 1-deoxy-D-xylulose-5-phosphate reductoisomerase [Chlamydiae bacterium CG10_big_fil_rev_8_21_14_0_10_35_9]|nr:MAG: 1-deoxy-D-xylulose-5-phosphate reductoisomerase [Chlamydiae bacterium CG10_big_fil_rev_8_21_14_0_10_35_9]
MMAVAIFGSTGSIGKSTLEVIRCHPDKFKVKALIAKSNINLLERQIKEFNPEYVVVFDHEKSKELQKRLSGHNILSGIDGLLEVVQKPSIDTIVLAMTGTTALEPAIEAIKLQKKICIANKELLVSAGKLITDLAKKYGTALLPIDSEHSALFQCLNGERKKEVSKLILTASGGPFRTFTKQELANVSVKQALEHPKWKMGPKNTIDSSTLMNKGLEVIEAHFLFDMPIDKIEVLVHPQSIVHSMVEFCDQTVMANLSYPTMTIPIRYALSYPERLPSKEKLDFSKHSELTFEPVDFDKFPCLFLALDAVKKGMSYPCYLNAANEILVERFLDGEISWIDIADKLKKLIASHTPQNMLTLESILSVDLEAKKEASKI